MPGVASLIRGVRLARTRAQAIPVTLDPAAFREELFNALTHGVGILASVAGGAVLIALGAAVSASDRRYHRERRRAEQPAGEAVAKA